LLVASPVLMPEETSQRLLEVFWKGCVGSASASSSRRDRAISGRGWYVAIHRKIVAMMSIGVLAG
jgi:hypothetical protein